MTKQEIKKLQKIELEKWNSFISEKQTGDEEWLEKKRFLWAGVYEILEVLGIEPIRDSRRLY